MVGVRVWIEGGGNKGRCGGVIAVKK